MSLSLTSHIMPPYNKFEDVLIEKEFNLFPTRNPCLVCVHFEVLDEKKQKH